MTEKLKSIILAEVAKTKKGVIVATHEYCHTISLNHRQIECNTAEIIKSKNASVVVNQAQRRFKSPKSKVVGINLLTGEPLYQGGGTK